MFKWIANKFKARLIKEQKLLVAQNRWFYDDAKHRLDTWDQLKGDKYLRLSVFLDIKKQRQEDILKNNKLPLDSELSGVLLEINKFYMRVYSDDETGLYPEHTMNSFADEFIQKLPNKYDTLIGENGIRLSGGEKQRLSIARAILKKSPIILLDEATSSLDAETESKIQKAVSFLTEGRTTIVIAHRLSTILNSDKIYVIENGQIAGSGSHDELLNTSSIYKNFYEKQIKK